MDTDPLTGLASREHTEQHLAMAASAARRQGGAFSLLLVALDHPERIGDPDGVMEAVAERVARGLRTEDVAGRWDNDEILVVLPATRLEGAWRVGQRMCAAVSDTPVASEVVTVSVGCAEGSGAEVEDHLVRARHALEEAKAAGRNQVRTDAYP